MDVTKQDQLIEFIDAAIGQVDNQKLLSIQFQVSDESIELHKKVINHFKKIKYLLETTKLSLNYVNQFLNEVTQTLELFPYRKHKSNQVQPDQVENAKHGIETYNHRITYQLELIEFNYNFFEKLGFLRDNIVAVGANGSGKTTLSNGLKKYLPQNGVVISAQKVLIVPTFSGISNYDVTNQKLQTIQQADKSLRTTYSTESNGNSYHILSQLGGELQILLDNLLAERSAIRNQFCDSLNNGSTDTKVPLTKLDKTLSIWNSLIQHRTIECNDGINITLKINEGIPYPGHQMSDGEKVALYLVAQVLQAPSSGFIIIDEPEMYLHKTILNKLWDKLERERGDCIFIYLTHDLDFAVSRTAAKKIWIRTFVYPDKWEIENIKANEIPEALLLELLGSRKNILFCEGRKGSTDEKIYNILFPEYTICPVEGCFSVINFTKSFNKIPNSLIRAYGLIDKDHHSTERLTKLKSDNIFSTSMTEPENLLLDSEFLKFVAKQLLKEEEVVNLIQEEVFETFKSEMELQTANYVTAKINYYFNDSHVSKGNTLNEVIANYLAFTQKINLDDWFQGRKSELERITGTKDYKGILSVFNHKGLKSLANKHLKISDFSERAQKILLHQPETQELLKKYFPEEIR